MSYCRLGGGAHNTPAAQDSGVAGDGANDVPSVEIEAGAKARAEIGPAGPPIPRDGSVLEPEVALIHTNPTPTIARHHQTRIRHKTAGFTNEDTLVTVIRHRQAIRQDRGIQPYVHYSVGIGMPADPHSIQARGAIVKEAKTATK